MPKLAYDEAHMMLSEKTPRNAREAGLASLYHYQKFDPGHLEDLLINQRFYCSDLANLNDPWDCRPWFSAETLNKPELREEFVEWILSHEPTLPVSKEQRLATATRLRIDTAYLSESINLFSRNFLKLIPGRWRIYCLTPHPDSTLMWSHYADNHRGLSLEYATASSIFGFALTVKYLPTYPDWTPQSLMKHGEHHVLLTKSNAWHYEDEYRLVGLAGDVPRSIENHHPLIMKGPYLDLPPGALQSIIIGCESKDSDAIVSLVQKHAPEVNIKRAVRSSNEYKLEIV
jgi:hypothetical protein